MVLNYTPLETIWQAEASSAVALSVEVQMRGRVIERRPDPRLKYYDLFSQKYTGKPWPYRDEESPIVLVIEIVKAKYSQQPFKHTPPSR